MIFREEQRFRQAWLKTLMIFLNLLFIMVLGHGLITQLVLKRPWGNRPLSDSELMLVTALAFVIIGSITYLISAACLVTEVRGDGIYIKFIPFHREFRKIGWSEIRQFGARTYRPIREYGGWGIRYGCRGMAYNVSGNRGVQFELTGGKKILIGSQNAEELAGAIASASGKAPVHGN